MSSELIKRAKRKLGRLRLVDVARLHMVQEVQHLTRLFKYLDVGIVYDVGANQGQYAQMLRKEVGYKGVIVSVEPIPEMVAILNKKSKADPKWHIEPIVVADVAGDRKFNIMQDRQCSSLSDPTLSETTVYREQTNIVESISVRGVTLESLVSKWRKVYGEARNSFLKLDTQGYDLQILNAANSVRHSFVAFQSEISVKRLYESSCRIERVLEAYRSYGFDISALVPNNSGNFPDLIEIDCIMIRSDLIAGQRPSDSFTQVSGIKNWE